MYIRILLASVVTLVMSACTSYSGPTHNTDVVTLTNGEQAWRVQCLGLLENSNTCMNRAKEICKDKNVRLIGSVDHAKSDTAGKNDPHEITFQCGNPPVAQVAPAPVVAPVQAAPQPLRALTLQGDANFATGSANLSPAAQTKLDEFIEANRGYKLERLTISGHTDSTGSASLNQRLSTDRARATQNYLMSHGLTAKTYDVRGFASSMPVASNATADGRFQNRRVEITTDGVEIRATGR